jgi:protein-disulfide isomerase
MKSVTVGLALLLVGLGVSSAPAQSPAAPLSREEIETIVREYILKHPEVLLESVRGLEERQRAEQADQVRRAIATHREQLLSDPAAPVAGNPQGDVTVVEFFDYRCPHCQRVAGTVEKLLEEDKGVRIVYKEWPVLGPDSVVAARAALAAHRQGKYLAFHKALLASTEGIDRARVLAVAASVGLDTAALEKAMDEPEIAQALQRNHTLARSLGLSGTPAFIIGSEFAPGAIGLDVMKDMVARARQK